MHNFYIQACSLFNFILFLYWVHPILKTREEQRQFHLLIKGLQNYPDHFQVCFRMSVVQCDSLPTILEPHVEKKTTNFHKPNDPEQQLVVCLRDGHTQRLSLSLLLSNNPLKDLDRYERTQKNQPSSEKKYDGWRVSESVCTYDWPYMMSHFFQTCQFRMEKTDSVCKGFNTQKANVKNHKWMQILNANSKWP